MVESVSSFIIEIWLMLILMMILTLIFLMIMMIMVMMMTMILMMIIMMFPYDYDDATDDDHHKNDSYTAAGAAPGASVPCSLFIYKFRDVKLREPKIR